MRRIQPLAEPDVVALFLVSEIDSHRHGPPIRQALQRRSLPRSLIDAADTGDPQANDLRRQVLAEMRDYGRDRGLFEGFPQEVTWESVALTPDELWRGPLHRLRLLGAAVAGHAPGRRCACSWRPATRPAPGRSAPASWPPDAGSLRVLP